KQRYYAGDAAVAAALRESLDLTAIATVADVIPLTDENRTLVKYGLAALNKGRRPVLRRLASAIGLKTGEIVAHNIAFGIAPHINAAGRMADASPAAELFLAEDEAKADEIIEELIQYNAERRELQERLTEQCAELAKERYAEDRILLLRPSGSHEGVSGIVAGRVKDKYGLPAIVLSETSSEEGGSGSNSRAQKLLKGSARSVPGADIIAMLRRHAHMFLKLGGHAMAAGFTMIEDNEDLLRELLNEDMAELLDAFPDLLDGKARIDAEVSAQELTLELAERLRMFEPTGMGNPRPLLRLSNVPVKNVKRMGAGGRHMRFTADGVPCVLFGAAEEYAEIIAEGEELSLTGVLDVNSWNGRESAQFIVRDARVADLEV
ncbi:MAG: DHH family phosphoesterase, partial [Clostridiales Family XIII bacterium]|nr:DHH family phosphoesterase [Clostridiales Family XIII bacterium]